jgi:hypothetical protein
MTARDMPMNAALKAVLGVILGGAAGFGWYRLVGCPTGTCPLSSNPYVRTIIGIVIGLTWSLN